MPESLHPSWSRTFRIVQWAVIGALIIASVVVESAGHATVSWVLDGVAVASYVLFRMVLARRQRRRS